MSSIAHMLRYPFPVSEVQIPGLGPVAYADMGSGPETLVFIHGMGSNLKAWSHNLPFFAEKYRCIALDLPGHGKSEKTAQEVSMGGYAQAVLALLDALGIAAAWLVGHSMGGQLALTLALESPAQVKGLVLSAPAGIETFDQEGMDWYTEVFTPDKLQMASENMIRANMEANFYSMDSLAQALVTDRLNWMAAADYPFFCRGIAGSIQAMLKGPVFDRLGKITQPVVMFFGEDDRYIPNPRFNPVGTAAIAKKGAAAFPNSQLHLFAACGHFPQLEQAGRFNTLADAWLSP